MQLANSSSIPVTVTVTNDTTQSQNYNGQLQPGSTQMVPLTTDFTYTVLANAISQSPATKSSITANANVGVSLKNGVLTIGIN